MFSFEPRGRHVITLCDGTACHVRGSSRLVDTVKQELGIDPGQTSGDRLFTLEVVNCLGACALAPVAVIDGVTHGKVTPGKLSQRLDQLRQAEPVEAEAAHAAV